MSDFCPQCSEPLKRTPTYDAVSDTMRYPCSNNACTFVLVTETIANKKKTALKLLPVDVIRLKRGQW